MANRINDPLDAVILTKIKFSHDNKPIRPIQIGFHSIVKSIVSI